VRTINITERDISAAVDRAAQVMITKKGTLIIYYSAEKDKLVVAPKHGIAKPLRADIASRPEMVAGEYKRVTPAPVEKIEQDIKALAMRINGLLSEKGQKSRLSQLRRRGSRRLPDFPLRIKLGERKTCATFSWRCPNAPQAGGAANG
jgi:hypothetical protein